MTVSPIASEEISLSPWLSSSRTILDTTWSMRSGSTGRLRNAICTDRTSLSRSNGTRRPLRLITTSSRSCTRSKVVKRKLHDRHTRRRRMTEESSVGRESFTCVSRLAQFGQRMVRPYAPSSNIDGKPADELRHLLPHGRFDQRILLDAFLRKDIEHLDDQLAHLLELGDAETARGAGRGAEADARSDRGLLRIEGNAVLVASDVGAAERQLRHLTGEALGPQVHQHQMRIGAAGDDI